MKKLVLFSFFFLLMDGFFYSQALVEDIAANKQLALLNAALREVEATNASTKAGVLETLTEAKAQTEQIYEDAEYIREIQDDLEMVSDYIKSFNSIENSVNYSIKTINSYANIVSIITKAEGFDQDVLSEVIDIISPVMEENRNTINNLRKLIQDEAIKTDEGTRLNLLMSLEKSIKDNYNKMSLLESHTVSMFKN